MNQSIYMASVLVKVYPVSGTRLGVLNITHHPLDHLPPEAVQMSDREFLKELRANPALAASLGPSGDEEPGDRALRIIHHRRRTAASEASDRRTGDRQECESRDSTDKDSSSNITWPEFVGAFVPLAIFGGKTEAKGKGGEGGQERASSSSDTFDEAGVGEEDLELLRVAFAMVCVGGSGGDAAVSLSELRQASAELDGEEPPEEPVRRALGVSPALLACCCCVYKTAIWALIYRFFERCLGYPPDDFEPPSRALTMAGRFE